MSICSWKPIKVQEETKLKSTILSIISVSKTPKIMIILKVRNTARLL